MAKERRSIGALDIGMEIELPETHHREDHRGRRVEIVDYTRTAEYGDSEVYAYADPDTGEYLGLVSTYQLPDGGATEVPVFAWK